MSRPLSAYSLTFSRPFSAYSFTFSRPSSIMRPALLERLSLSILVSLGTGRCKLKIRLDRLQLLVASHLPPEDRAKFWMERERKGECGKKCPMNLQFCDARGSSLSNTGVRS